MKKLKLSISLVIRILLILATTLAIAGLPITYGMAYWNVDNLDESKTDTVSGIELFTPFIALALQLLFSSLLLFLEKRKWLSVLLLVLSVCQLVFILIIVRLEVELQWLFGPYSFALGHFGWGYWLLLMASVLVIAGCILNFFVKHQVVRDERIIDNLEQ